MPLPLPLTNMSMLQLPPVLPAQQGMPALPAIPDGAAAEAASQAAAAALLQEEEQATEAAQQAKHRKAAKKARQKQRKQVRHGTWQCLRSDLVVHGWSDYLLLQLLAHISMSTLVLLLTSM